LFAQQGHAAEENSPELLAKRYNLAKIYFHNLTTYGNIARSRVKWENTIRKFRKIYLAAPKQELGMSSLFMMGRIYQEMSWRFNNPHDLDEAIAYYEDVAILFPESELADDALYLLGWIYLNDKEDKQHAAVTFYQITCQYPQGDMAALAAKKLEVLKQAGATPVQYSERSNGDMSMVLPIKHWSTDDYTRVVVKVTEPVLFSEHLLEKMGNHPRRLYIDFSNSHIPPEACNPVPIQDGLLKRVRVGQFTRDTVRVVLDIESISKYKIFSLQDPFRVIIDVKGWDEEENIEEKPVILGSETPTKKKAANGNGTTTAASSTPTLAQQLGLGIRRIVIDPGHGGKDPGAIAPNGVKEKDVVLAVAKKLADDLRRRLSCEVILTRTTDVFIPLEERTAIANTERGDLFISLHVNSAPEPYVKGVETYILNLTNDEDSMRLAALENATSASNMSDLQNILAGLLNNNKLDESTKLAEHVQTNMAEGLKLKDLGVKQAPFYVLIGAQMPAILSEITFLSNPTEAERLRNENYIGAIAERISTGIRDYVSDSHLAMADRYAR